MVNEIFISQNKFIPMHTITNLVALSLFENICKCIHSSAMLTFFCKILVHITNADNL